MAERKENRKIKVLKIQEMNFHRRGHGKNREQCQGAHENMKKVILGPKRWLSQCFAAACFIKE